MTIYYVSPGGSDSNAGTDKDSSPFKTIQKGINTATAGDTVEIAAGTYTERLATAASGGSGTEITITAGIDAQTLQLERVILKSVSSSPYYMLNLTHNYIIVNGIEFQHAHRVKGQMEAWINMGGNNSTIQNCKIGGTSYIAFAYNNGTRLNGDRGITVSGDNNRVHNCTVVGLIHGVQINGSADSCTISDCTITDTAMNNITLNENAATNTHRRIVGCTLLRSIFSDNIQMMPDFGDRTALKNYGLVVEDCILGEAGENNFDSKAARYVLIQRCIMYGAVGSNDGESGGYNTNALGSVYKGSTENSRNIIIRNCVVFDGAPGIFLFDEGFAYNCTVVNCRRDYTGNPGTIVTANKRDHNITSGWGLSRLASGIRNCISIGAQILIAWTETAKDLDIDYNLYDTTGGYKWGGDIIATLAAWKTLLSGEGSVTGADANSTAVAGTATSALFENAKWDTYYNDTGYRFKIDPAGAAYQAGSYLTLANGAGVASTTLIVDESRWFTDGIDGTITGDTIFVGGTEATISSINYATHTIELASAISWSDNDEVYFETVTPHIGANLEVGDTGTPPPPPPPPPTDQDPTPLDLPYDATLNDEGINALHGIHYDDYIYDASERGRFYPKDKFAHALITGGADKWDDANGGLIIRCKVYAAGDWTLGENRFAFRAWSEDRLNYLLCRVGSTDDLITWKWKSDTFATITHTQASTTTDYFTVGLTWDSAGNVVSYYNGSAVTSTAYPGAWGDALEAISIGGVELETLHGHMSDFIWVYGETPDATNMSNLHTHMISSVGITAADITDEIAIANYSYYPNQDLIGDPPTLEQLIADFSLSVGTVSGAINHAVTFDFSDSTIPTGKTATYVLDPGDGTTPYSTASTTQAHTYTTVGAFDVTLTITLNDGTVDDEFKPDYITTWDSGYSAGGPPTISTAVAALYADYNDLREYILDQHGVGVIDTFAADVAAGSVDGTAATIDSIGTESGNTRDVVDTDSALSVASGAAHFTPHSTPDYNDPSLSYSATTRTNGRGMVCKVNFSVLDQARIGFTPSQNDSSSGNRHLFICTAILYAVDATGRVAIGALSTSTDYQLAVLLRATGAFYFLDGNLLYVGTAGTTATLYHFFGAYSSTYDLKHMRTVSGWLPEPDASDGGATPANRTDGLGHAEGVANSTGRGGWNRTWTSQEGTWSGTNQFTVASLDGTTSRAIKTVPTSSANMVVICHPTRSAGNVGITARYTDSDNFLIAYHDGTNCKLDQYVAGTPTNLITAVATYGAGYQIQLNLNSTGARLYYNGALVGTTSSINATLTATNAGLYSSDTGNTLDDFIVWRRNWPILDDMGDIMELTYLS